MNTAVRLSCVALVVALGACTKEASEIATEGPFEFSGSTSFDGEVLRLALDREDGGKERFSALRDQWYNWRWEPFLPNHTGRRWVMGKTDREGTSVAYTLVSWDNDDPTDYLAAGYWLRFDGFRRDDDLHIAAADLVMFVDGSELEPVLPSELPVSGTAIYVGEAGGIYTYGYGSDWTGYDAPEVGEEFYGTMTVQANFDDMTIAGCIGCDGDLRIERSHLYTIFGRRVAEPLAMPTDYDIELAPTTITPQGNFLSEVMTVTHPTRTVTQSGGEWSGSFSNRPAPDGTPRLVAGIASAAFTEADGSEGAFNSVFITAHPALFSASQPE